STLGAWTLGNVLNPGTYTIREEPQPFWAQTAPAAGSYTVTAVSGQNVANLDFGNQSGTVTGVKFNDLNGNGTRDTGEPLLGGWTVVADLNDNGLLAGFEPRVVTAPVADAQGNNYLLSGLPAGTYAIREVLLNPNWVQTFPAPSVHEVTIADETTRVG